MHRSSSKDQNVTYIQAAEEDQTIHMSVEAEEMEEASFTQSEMTEDEVILNHKSDGECFSDGEEGETTYEPNESLHLTHEQKMQKLEEEMQQKFREIEELMNMGGFTKNSKARTGRKVILKKVMNTSNSSNVKPGLNCNAVSNQIMDCLRDQIEGSTSEVTIYKNATQQKRASSSSEEGEMLNSSDETMQMDLPFDFITDRKENKEEESPEESHFE